MTRGASSPGLPAAPTAEETPAIDGERIRRLRVGHGANCSSIGSVVDTLFATAAVGAAVFAAVVAAMKSEDVKVVGERKGQRERRETKDR